MADLAAKLLKEHLDHDRQTLTALEGKIANDKLRVKEDEGKAVKLRAQIEELESALETLETGIAYG